MRLAFFREIAERENAAILMAHHADDVAETVLMRIGRGASMRSVQPMREWSPPFWRPLLGVTRADLAKYAVQHGITHCEDGSNATLKYKRNQVRHKLMPRLEEVFPGFSGKLRAHAVDAFELAALVEKEIVPQVCDVDFPAILHKKMLEFPATVFFLAVNQLFQLAGVRTPQLSRSQLQAIYDRLRALPRVSGRRNTLRWQLTRQYGLELQKGRISLTKIGDNPPV